jgi:hypothetical protein
MMKLKTEYEQLLGVILEDLRVCLQYTPSRENDLLCFMEQYIKAPKELRPTILQNLRACMDGKEYPNPYAVYQYYGEQEINLLEQLLRGYLQDMQSCSDKELVLTNLIAAINDLQDKCCGQLIDNWRKDHLTQLLALAAKEQCLSSAIAVIDSENRW